MPFAVQGLANVAVPGVWGALLVAVPLLAVCTAVGVAVLQHRLYRAHHERQPYEDQSNKDADRRECHLDAGEQKRSAEPAIFGQEELELSRCAPGQSPSVVVGSMAQVSPMAAADSWPPLARCRRG